MNITPSLFEALLKCPTKCWLRFTGEPPSGNSYAEWVQTEQESYRAAAAKRLIEIAPADECAVAPIAEHLKTDRWRLAVDVESEARASSPPISGNFSMPVGKPDETPGEREDETSALQCRLHTVERIPSEGRGKPAPAQAADATEPITRLAGGGYPRPWQSAVTDTTSNPLRKMQPGALGGGDYGGAAAPPYQRG